MIPKMKYSSNSKGIIHPSFDFKWKDLITIQLQQNHLSESEEEAEVVVEVVEEVNDELPPYPPFNNNNTSSNDQLELISNQSNQVLLYLQMNLQQDTNSSTSTVNNDVIRLYEETVVALNESEQVLQGTSNSIILL
jgi:hypothetical protein